MPVNLSANEEAIAIGARNDANEQEHVELHTPQARPEAHRLHQPLQHQATNSH